MKKLKKLAVIVLNIILLLNLTYLSVLIKPGIAKAAAPVVTTSNIGVTNSGTGTGGTFKIGDAVIGEFDDSANPLPAATSATIDFSEFGGGPQPASETGPGSRIWQASYTVVPGVIDITTADISVAATNDDGPTGPVNDNEDYLVDNQAPSIVGQGTLDIIKNSPYPSTPTRVGIGDQVVFGNDTLDLGDGTAWTVNLFSPVNLTGEAALPAGPTSAPALENNLDANYRFPVIGTDNAGNTTIISNGTNLIDIDTQRPTLVSANTETVSTILVNFSETIISGSVQTADFQVTNPPRTASVADRITSTQVRLLLVSAFSTGATPTITIIDDGSTGLYDNAGNRVNIGSSVVASDGIKPQVGPDVIGLVFQEGKNDRLDTLIVGFSENIPTIGGSGDYIITYNGNPLVATAVANAGGDNTVELTIPDQSDDIPGSTFSVMVDTAGNVRDAAGNAVDLFQNSAVSGPTSSFDTYVPVIVGVTISPNSGLLGIGATVEVRVTTDDTLNDQNLLTFSGTINGQPIVLFYDVVDNRYEYTYLIAPGDPDAVNVEALSLQLQDRAGNLSPNIMSSTGSALVIDANAPIAPVITSPASAQIINADSYDIYGTAEDGSIVKIYTDPNNDGDPSDGALVGIGSASGFTINIPLIQNVENNFVATASDAAGNEGPAADIPTITEDSIAPVVSLNFPNGGEKFAEGFPAIITWTPATDGYLAANPISLYYSTDGGATYPNLIASGEANDGSYGWSVPLDVNSDLVRIEIVALDLAGNLGSDTSDSNFIIDNSLPNSTVSPDLQGQVYGPNTWDNPPLNGQISGTAFDYAADVSQVKLTLIDPNGLYWNGAGWQGAPTMVGATGTINWSYALDKINLGAEGAYTLAAQAIDDITYGISHEQSPMSSGYFIWDEMAPTADIINPNVLAIWRQGNRTITWNASDDNFGPQPITLEYSLDDGASWATITLATENDGAYDWNIASGTNTNQARVRLTATDLADNTIQDISDQFTIDSTQPEIALDSPIGGYLGGTILLQATASDNPPPASPSGINYVRFQYRPGSSGSWLNIFSDYLAPYEISFDTTLVSDGNYQLRAQSYDLAGNSRSSSPVTAIIDNTAPVSTITNPANSGSGSTIYLNSWTGDAAGTAADGASGVNKVEVSIQRSGDNFWWDGANWVFSASEILNLASGTAAWTYPVPTDLADGTTYTLTAKATDNVGNLETSYVLYVVYDTEAPEVKIVRTPDKDISNTDYAFTVDFGDAAIKEYKLSSGLWISYTGPVAVSTEGDYTFFAKGVDLAGNEKVVTVSFSIDKTVPANPAAPSASVINGAVSLAWEIVSDADHYEIWRSSSPWVLIAVVPGSQNTYTDTGVERGKTYQYRIIAVDEAGNKSSAALVSILVPAPRQSAFLAPIAAQAAEVAPQETTESAKEGKVQAEQKEEKAEETTKESGKTNWSLIIAILIAAAIVIAGVLYWWYAREEEEDEI